MSQSCYHRGNFIVHAQSPCFNKNRPTFFQRKANTSTMPKIFISYRRTDTADISRRLYDALVKRLGQRSVFRDVDTLVKGENFRAGIERFLINSDVMLVMIGRQWLDVRDEKTHLRRLDDPEDPVRTEVEMGLRQVKTVIPVLVNGAPIPDEESLPRRLSQLTFQNAVRLNDATFDDDLHKLLKAIGITRRAHLPLMLASAFLVVVLAVLMLNYGLPRAQALSVSGITPNMTLTLDALVTQILATSAANSTLTAIAYTPTMTASPTADATQTHAALYTHATVLAAQQIATQQAQLSVNAPTNTPEIPTATATHTASPSPTPSPTLDMAATAAQETRIFEQAIATADAQVSAQATPRPVWMVQTVPSSNVNLRNGPSTQYERLALIPPNTRLIVIQPYSDGVWYQVWYQEQVGWVDAQAVIRIEPLLLVRSNPSVNVNLRSGTSTQHRRLAIIPPGTTLPVFELGGQGAWYRVVFENQIGWVSAETVTLVSAP